MEIGKTKWREQTIDELTQNVASGKSLTNDKNGDYPIYGSTGIIGFSNQYDYEGEKILVARVGANAGKTNKVSGKYCVSDNTLMITNKSEYNIDFAFFQLLYLNLNKLVFGSGQPLVTGGQIKQLYVSVPPTLAEQKAIATALSDVDALISNLEKLIAKKKAIKQGAMQQLLTGKKRLPGFSGEWVERNLGKSSTLKARIGWQGLTTDEYLSSGNFYLVTGTDFKKGYIDWDNCVYVEKERFDQDKNIQVKVEDILVTKDGTIGKVAFINKVSKPTTLNSGVFVIRPVNNSYNPRYLYFILMSNHFIDFLGKLTAGSTISHLYQKDFVHYNFPVPPSLEEQKAIALTLSDMDIEIEALVSKKAKYQQIKQGMMQELLTGKIRLV